MAKVMKKSIHVKEAGLSNAGLEILYTINGEERFETISPAAAAQEFESHGIIIEYWQLDEEVMVRWIADYMDDEETTAVIKKASWEMFAQHYTLSQYEAIRIAAHIEHARQLRQAMKQAQAENTEKYAQMVDNYQHVIIPESLS